MVLLHHIVEVFALTQTNPTREDALSFQPFHSRRKGPVLVHIDDPWHRIAGRAQSLTEEALGRSRIPLGGEQKLDRLTCPWRITNRAKMCDSPLADSRSTLSKTLNPNTFNGPLNVPNLGWKSPDWG